MKLYIFYYDKNQKKLNKIKEYSDNVLKPLLINNNLIKFNNDKYIVFLKNEFCYFLNKNDFSINKFFHQIQFPSYFYKLNENSIIIGNIHNYNIFLIDIEKNKYIEFNQKHNLNISGKVTSFYALKNGRIVITTTNLDSFNKEMNVENSGYIKDCGTQ